MSELHFSVSRQRDTVYIREIPPGASDFSFVGKRAAWTHAQNIAMPAKASNRPTAKVPARIVFVDRETGEHRVVQSAEETQQAWEASRRPQQATAEHGTPEPPAPAAWIDQDPSHREAIEHLRNGRQNEFTESVLGYFDRNGRLTDNQLAAVLRGKAKYEAAKAAGPIPDVPAGRYALAVDDGEVKFFVVDRPTEGKWAGYTFLRQQAGDEEYPVKGARRNEILNGILAAGPAEAMKLYGREIGCCGHCGRTLTSEWRHVGIGPICAGKMGF